MAKRAEPGASGAIIQPGRNKARPIQPRYESKFLKIHSYHCKIPE